MNQTGEVTITRLDVPRCKLGEGPVWDVAEQALYYVDAAGNELRRYSPDTGTSESWAFAGRVATFALRENGGAIVALWNGFHLFDFDTHELTLIGQPDPENHPRTQLNDGKADSAGRFLCGSVDTLMTDGLGALYSVEPSGRIVVLEKGIQISNGPCFSPDGTTFYHADSMKKEIYAYDYDVEKGSIASKRVFATTHELGGIPDGATVDSKGYLWSAICEGGKVVRFAPDGTLDRIIDVPTSMTSSVMFGGSDLSTLYVTTIDPPTFGGAPEESGGSLYAIDGIGVTGLPEHRFAG